MNLSDSPQHQARSLGFFITGTDTEVGKTLVASALVYALRQKGLSAVGMKPVAAGAEWRAGRWHNDDVDALSSVSSPGFEHQLINPYLFNKAVAPHLAAKAEGKTIDPDVIIRSYHRLRAEADAVVVEGVGGFMVPLHNQYTTADLARDLQLPVVLVVGMQLGCISHALLTVQAIAQEGLVLAGWVANTLKADMPFLHENVNTLRLHIRAPYLGTIPRLSGVQHEKAAAIVDWSPLFAI